MDLELWINHIKSCHSLMFKEMLFKFYNKMLRWPFTLIFHLGDNLVEIIFSDEFKNQQNHHC
jgi:hypothetical protein